MKHFKMNGSIVTDNDAWFYDWLEIESVSPKKVTRFLEEAKGEDIKLSINSGGGEITAGSEIYTALMNYQGKITAEVTGMCASMASMIMLAAEHISISPTATIMIHNVWSVQQGDYQLMEHKAKFLKDISNSFAKMYAKRMNCTVEEAQSAMDKETFYTAQQALEVGLVDEVLFEEKEAEAPLQIVASNSIVFPSNKIAELQELFKGKAETPKVQLDLDSEKFQAMLDEKIKQYVNKSADKPLKNQNFKPKYGGLI